MKAIFSQIVFVFIYLLLYLISLLPLNVLYALAGFLFVWPMKLLGYRRTVILPTWRVHSLKSNTTKYGRSVLNTTLTSDIFAPREYG
jgi:hypothetical protein